MLQTAPSAGGAGAANPAQPGQTATQPQPQNQQAQPASSQQQQPTPASVSDDLFSLDRIRRDLERRATITLPPSSRNLPVYRLLIEGYQFKAPSWRDNFAAPVPPVPEPLGGSDFYRMQSLATLPQAWGSPTPFANSAVTDVYGVPSAGGLVGALITKGLEARRNAAATRLHEEVQQELADIAAHNARVAAGRADPDDGDAKKAAEKKKQDAEKKKKKKD